MLIFPIQSINFEEQSFISDSKTQAWALCPYIYLDFQ